MNLNDSIELNKLTSAALKPVTKKLSADEVAKKVIQASARKSWLMDYVASDEFILMDIDPRTVASPEKAISNRVSISASSDSNEPAVIDINKNKIGKSTIGYVPKVIFIEGSARASHLRLSGARTVRAWVGSKALQFVQAESQFVADPNQTPLDRSITIYGNGPGGPASSSMQQGSNSVANPPIRAKKVKAGATSVVEKSAKPMSPSSEAPGAGVGPRLTGAKGRVKKIVTHGKGCECKACSDNMKAGGPGSGRRPEGGQKAKYDQGRLISDQRPMSLKAHNLLTQNGFKFKGTQYDGEGRSEGISTYSHPKHGDIDISQGSFWHNNKTGANDYDFKSLKDHVANLGGKRG